MPQRVTVFDISRSNRYKWNIDFYSEFDILNEDVVVRKLLVSLMLITLSVAAQAQQPKHILFAFVDHFEPNLPVPDPEVAMWANDYVAMAGQHVDADGRHPVHTFFQMFSSSIDPDKVHGSLKMLNQLTYSGYGEVEFHLHHGITYERERTEAEAVQEFIWLTQQAKSLFNSRGALITAEPSPQFTFGFIHGMWALDNSRYNYWDDPTDPHFEYCGVYNELFLLNRLGAYADFTFPAWATMEPFIPNVIFYARDDFYAGSYLDPHNIRFVEINQPAFGDLMIIQGPKTDTRIGILEGQYNAPATLERMDMWVSNNVHVFGRGDWIFVKVHTHGCAGDLRQADVWDAFFGESIDRFYRDIQAQYNDGHAWKLHYVSAREMYNIIKAAEAGLGGDPGQYRDFLIPPYANTLILTGNPYGLVTYGDDMAVLEILDTSSVVDVRLKDYAPDATILESDDLSLEWGDFDGTQSKGTLGELHFSDSTPSRFYSVNR